MSAPIRVLVADDCARMRRWLSEALAAEGFLVVAAASDGDEAVGLARTHHPDVVVLDDQMPRLDGVGAARQIMRIAPARVLVVSGANEDERLRLAVEAAAAGALELVARPEDAREGGGGASGWIRRLAQTVRLMSEVPVIRRRDLVKDARAAGLRPLAALGLVASTGGPPALATILGGLPPELPIPVMVAQHLPPGALPGLLRWLAEVCPLPIVEARHGEAIAPGRVYFAPDHADLRVVAPGIAWLRPAANGYFSSGNALLESLAETYGARAAGVVLSGMGEDGASGLLRIRQEGGITFAQSAESCAVFGMPGAAARCGATRELLGPEAILRRIVLLAGGGNAHGGRGGARAC